MNKKDLVNHIAYKTELTTKKLSLEFTEGNYLCETSTAKFSPGKFFKQRINVQN